MKLPQRAQHSVSKFGDDGIVHAFTHWDVSVADGFLVPTAGYSVASIEVRDAASTSLSTGVLTLVATNDAAGNQGQSHPGAVTYSVAGTKAAFAVEHAHIGLDVTTVQASVILDVWVYLKALPT